MWPGEKPGLPTAPHPIPWGTHEADDLRASRQGASMVEAQFGLSTREPPGEQNRESQGEGKMTKINQLCQQDNRYGTSP